jgi:heme exporter protein C
MKQKKMERIIRWTTDTVYAILILGLCFWCTVTCSLIIWTEVDSVQGEAYRIIYWHVPAAWWCFASYTGATLSAFLYLWKKNPLWDKISWSWVQVSFFWGVLTVITGSLWGKTTWGVYWVWDARLTTILGLVIILLGVFILRKRIGSPELQAKYSAFWVILGAWNIPLIKASVDWWNTLHQGSSISFTGSTLYPSILWTLLTATLSSGFLTWILFILFLRYSILWDRIFILQNLLSFSFFNHQNSTLPFKTLPSQDKDT